MWEAQAMGDAGAIGDSSAESLYIQGKQAKGDIALGMLFIPGEQYFGSNMADVLTSLGMFSLTSNPN